MHPYAISLPYLCPWKSKINAETLFSFEFFQLWHWRLRWASIERYSWPILGSVRVSWGLHAWVEATSEHLQWTVLLVLVPLAKGWRYHILVSYIGLEVTTFPVLEPQKKEHPFIETWAWNSSPFEFTIKVAHIDHIKVHSGKSQRRRLVSDLGTRRSKTPLPHIPVLSSSSYCIPLLANANGQHLNVATNCQTNERNDS